MGSIPGLGRCPGGGHGNIRQDSCLKNPMDRGVWWATVYGVLKSRTRLKWLSTQQSRHEDSILMTQSPAKRPPPSTFGRQDFHIWFLGRHKHSDHSKHLLCAR